MVMRINFDEDFDVIDDVDVIYFTPAGTTNRFEIPKAFRRQVTIREAAASDGAYSVRDTAFTAPRCAMESAPEVGSLITTACGDEVFYVYAVDRIVNNTQFRMYCRRGYLQSELTDFITVNYNVGGKDDYGVAFKSWIPLLNNHPAKIQETENSIASDQDRTILYREAQIYTLSTKEITAGMQVITRDKTKWNINSVTGKGELGLLIVLDVVEARAPGA